MPRTTTTISPKTTRTNSSIEGPGRPNRSAESRVVGISTAAVLSMGCPRGIGPEVCLRVALARSAPKTVIVGHRGVLAAAARALGLAASTVDRIPAFESAERHHRGPALLEVGPELRHHERSWGKPDQAAGVAQLVYIEQGFALAREHGWPLVTAPVSKEAIAKSGLRRARKFRGHTEWLEHLDGAPHSVMCFSSPRLTCSLVTTHVPLRALSRLITPRLVNKAICELCDLLLRRGVRRPRLAVCSLNPHGGEGELLGKEEGTSVLPGIDLSRALLGRRAQTFGPIGAETAFRKAVGGVYDGVVALYHDQATIPMKLVDFGGAVNVTQGLSIVRTSVDHGTAYDIAGRGLADAKAMTAALRLGLVLGASRRQVQHGNW